MHNNLTINESRSCTVGESRIMSFIVGRLKILSTTFLHTILHQLQIIQFTLNFKFIKFQQILSYPKKHRTLLINIRSNISKIDDSNRRLDSSNNFNRVSF